MSEWSVSLLTDSTAISLVAYLRIRFTTDRYTTNGSAKAFEATRKLHIHVPDTQRKTATNADRYPHDHASASRLRLRGSYGTIEWMMRMEFAPLYMTLGIGISSQLLSIMPWVSLLCIAVEGDLKRNRKSRFASLRG